MDMNIYQDKARYTAIYPDQGQLGGILYAALGLAGEAGEVANKAKKLLRDGDTDERRYVIRAEIGDVLWYVSQLCEELNVTLGTVAVQNLEKLYGRKSDGTLGGSGDAR